jgi:hypothetical protein
LQSTCRVAASSTTWSSTAEPARKLYCSEQGFECAAGGSVGGGGGPARMCVAPTDSMRCTRHKASAPTWLCLWQHRRSQAKADALRARVAALDEQERLRRFRVRSCDAPESPAALYPSLHVRQDMPLIQCCLSCCHESASCLKGMLC